MKPPAPPLPMHRRSKSEGRTPFGEDIPLAKDPKPPVEKKLSSPLDKQEETRPTPPPRPLKPGSVSVRVKSSSPSLANGEITSSRSASLPRPPPRVSSELSSPKASVETESDDKTETIDESDVAVPESPIPDLPPRAPGVKVASGLPRRVQALYDCEADNEDELTFKEGDILLVKGEGEDAEWWVGEVEGQPGKSGVFPISFVRILTD